MDVRKQLRRTRNKCNQTWAVPRRLLKKTSLREIASKKQQASAVWAKPTWIRRGFLEAEKRVIGLGAAGTLMENLEGSLFLKELT